MVLNQLMSSVIFVVLWVAACAAQEFIDLPADHWIMLYGWAAGCAALFISGIWGRD